MTTPPDDQATPLYTTETPSHVPERTPSEPNVVKRTDEATTTTVYDVADVDDADDV